MKDIIIELLGEYQLKYDDTGNLIGGLAGIDYQYLIGAFLFCISIFFCLKCICSLIVSAFQGR